MEKARVTTSRKGPGILVPETGNAAALFLEFIRDYQKTHGQRPTIEVTDGPENEDGIGQPLLVRLTGHPLSTHQAAARYINQNL